jgi:hypothetical protein
VTIPGVTLRHSTKEKARYSGDAGTRSHPRSSSRSCELTQETSKRRRRYGSSALMPSWLL